MLTFIPQKLSELSSDYSAYNASYYFTDLNDCGLAAIKILLCDSLSIHSLPASLSKAVIIEKDSRYQIYGYKIPQDENNPLTEIELKAFDTLSKIKTNAHHRSINSAQEDELDSNLMFSCDEDIDFDATDLGDDFSAKSLNDALMYERFGNEKTHDAKLAHEHAFLNLICKIGFLPEEIQLALIGFTLPIDDLIANNKKIRNHLVQQKNYIELNNFFNLLDRLVDIPSHTHLQARFQQIKMMNKILSISGYVKLWDCNEFFALYQEKLINPLINDIKKSLKTPSDTTQADVNEIIKRYNSIGHSLELLNKPIETILRRVITIYSHLKSYDNIYLKEAFDKLIEQIIFSFIDNLEDAKLLFNEIERNLDILFIRCEKNPENCLAYLNVFSHHLREVCATIVANEPFTKTNTFLEESPANEKNIALEATKKVIKDLEKLEQILDSVQAKLDYYRGPKLVAQINERITEDTDKYFTSLKNIAAKIDQEFETRFYDLTPEDLNDFQERRNQFLYMVESLQPEVAKVRQKLNEIEALKDTVIVPPQIILNHAESSNHTSCSDDNREKKYILSPTLINDLNTETKRLGLLGRIFTQLESGLESAQPLRSDKRLAQAQLTLLSYPQLLAYERDLTNSPRSPRTARSPLGSNPYGFHAISGNGQNSPIKQLCSGQKSPSPVKFK